jgi:hypothetical protein
MAEAGAEVKVGGRTGAAVIPAEAGAVVFMSFSCCQTRRPGPLRDLCIKAIGGLIVTPRPKGCRHAELVSASTAQQAWSGLAEGWILKQVQDDGRFCRTLAAELWFVPG